MLCVYHACVQVCIHVHVHNHVVIAIIACVVCEFACMCILDMCYSLICVSAAIPACLLRLHLRV
jgi:hypothetical protein